MVLLEPLEEDSTCRLGIVFKRGTRWARDKRRRCPPTRAAGCRKGGTLLFAILRGGTGTQEGGSAEQDVEEANVMTQRRCCVGCGRCPEDEAIASRAQLLLSTSHCKHPHPDNRW
jgi:hypothetical protein